MFGTSCPAESSLQPPSVSCSSPLGTESPAWRETGGASASRHPCSSLGGTVAPRAGFGCAPLGKQSLRLRRYFCFSFYKLLPSLHGAGKVELFVHIAAWDTILLLITSREAQRFLGLEETVIIISFGKFLPWCFWVLSKRKMVFVFLCP